jgi:hypothetical protein
LFEERFPEGKKNKDGKDKNYEPYKEYDSIFNDFLAKNRSKVRLEDSDMLFDLLNKMLVVNPERRLSSYDALKHPYFNGMETYVSGDPSLWAPRIPSDPGISTLRYFQEYPTKNTLGKHRTKYCVEIFNKVGTFAGTQATAYMAIYYLDRFYENHRIENPDLMFLACILLASQIAETAYDPQGLTTPFYPIVTDIGAAQIKLLEVVGSFLRPATMYDFFMFKRLQLEFLIAIDEDILYTAAYFRTLLIFSSLIWKKSPERISGIALQLAVNLTAENDPELFRDLFLPLEPEEVESLKKEILKEIVPSLKMFHKQMLKDYYIDPKEYPQIIEKAFSDVGRLGPRSGSP